MGTALALLGFLGFLFGLINVVYPLKVLRVTGRKMGAAILGGASVVFIVGIVLSPTPETSGNAGKTAAQSNGSSANPSEPSKSGDQTKPETSSAKQQGNTSTSATTSQPSQQKPSPKTIADVDLNDEVTANIFIPVFSGLDKVSKVEILPVAKDKKFVKIYYPLGGAGDENDVVKKSARQAVDAMSKLFGHPQITLVGVYSQGSFTDAYGKESTQDAVGIVWSREAAEKVEWKNFKDMVLTDFSRAFVISDDYFIHPGVWRELKPEVRADLPVNHPSPSTGGEVGPLVATDVEAVSMLKTYSVYEAWAKQVSAAGRKIRLRVEGTPTRFVIIAQEDDGNRLSGTRVFLVGKEDATVKEWDLSKGPAPSN